MTQSNKAVPVLDKGTENTGEITLNANTYLAGYTDRSLAALGPFHIAGLALHALRMQAGEDARLVSVTAERVMERRLTVLMAVFE